MKIFGYILLILGFLSAALTTVLDPEKVKWPFFVPLVILGIIGITIIRIINRKEAKCEHKLDSNMKILHSSLENITKNINELNNIKTTINVYDIHEKIDEVFLDDLDNFAEARESIIHIYSTQIYADIMSHFAAGERYLNRCWSASADGYIDEVHTYIEKSADQFTKTFTMLKQCSVHSD